MASVALNDNDAEGEYLVSIFPRDVGILSMVTGRQAVVMVGGCSQGLSCSGSHSVFPLSLLKGAAKPQQIFQLLCVDALRLFLTLIIEPVLVMTATLSTKI